MSNTNKEILAILRHYWKLGRNVLMPHVSCKMLKIMMPYPIVQHKIGTRNSRKVPPTFKRNHALEDHEVLCQRIEANPATITRQLLHEFGPFRWTIGCHPHQLKKKSKRCREVPHDLIAKQAVTCENLQRTTYKSPGPAFLPKYHNMGQKMDLFT